MIAHEPNDQPKRDVELAHLRKAIKQLHRLAMPEIVDNAATTL